MVFCGVVVDVDVEVERLKVCENPTLCESQVFAAKLGNFGTRGENIKISSHFVQQFLSQPHPSRQLILDIIDTWRSESTAQR